MAESGENTTATTREPSAVSATDTGIADVRNVTPSSSMVRVSRVRIVPVLPDDEDPVLLGAVEEARHAGRKLAMDDLSAPEIDCQWNIRLLDVPSASVVSCLSRSPMRSSLSQIGLRRIPS